MKNTLSGWSWLRSMYVLPIVLPVVPPQPFEWWLFHHLSPQSCWGPECCTCFAGHNLAAPLYCAFGLLWSALNLIHEWKSCRIRLVLTATTSQV
jgi:hypothetical protein